MAILAQIQTFIDQLDRKRFYQYLGGLLLIICLFFSLIIYYRWSKINDFMEQIEEVENQRVIVKKLLFQAKEVEKQKNEVIRSLQQEENFKIVDYLNQQLKKLNLSSALTDTLQPITNTELTGNYDELTLQAKLVGISMKQLTELLRALDEKKIIYVHDLDISRSKEPRSVDVIFTIATLQPKSERGVH